MESIRVLAFAREAGGAAAIAPVLLDLQGTSQLVVLAKDYAEHVFRDAGLAPVNFAEFSDPSVDETLNVCMGRERPDVVLTSATSLPYLDMTEKYLWRWAKERGVPSVAVVDQWQNYALRFSGPGTDERLKYLPDWITAMDGLAKRGMIADGIPEECIVITGQPAFDKLSQMSETYTSADRWALRQKIGVAPDARLLCFVAERFAQDFGDKLGYTEHSVLGDLLWVCERLLSGGRVQIHLAVKLHPQNKPEEFEWIQKHSGPPGLHVTLHWTEQPPTALVMASDAVVGMTSVLLLESILLGRPTVSFQPGGRQSDGLIATVLGAIPLIGDREACVDTLLGLLQDTEFRDDYLRRQALLAIDGAATPRVADLVRRVAARGSRIDHSSVGTR